MSHVPLDFAVIGDPVAHSISPAIHGAAFAALGLPHRYQRAPTKADELATRVAELRAGRWAGLNVTVPHKVAALSLADHARDDAARTGASNTLLAGSGGAVIAENTDVHGLVADWTRLAVRTERALILGAGGAARAAMLAAARVGARVAIAARRRSSAADVTAALGFGEVVEWEAIDAAGGFDMVINATSAGMQGADEGRAIADALISATLDSRSTAYDLVYRPWPGRRETPFIAEARARGLAAHDGLGMLVFQAARALELWLDRPLGPPVVEAMMAAARVAIDAPANG